MLNILVCRYLEKLLVPLRGSRFSLF